MKAAAFDAVLDFPLPRGAGEVRADAVFLGASAPVRLTDYAFAGRREARPGDDRARWRGLRQNGRGPPRAPFGAIVRSARSWSSRSSRISTPTTGPSPLA